MDGLDLRSKKHETHHGLEADDMARENICSDNIGASRMELAPGANVLHNGIPRNDLKTYGSFGPEFGTSFFDSFRDLGMPAQPDDYQIGFGIPPNEMQATSVQTYHELPRSINDRSHVEYRLSDVADEWGVGAKTDWRTESGQNHQTSPSHNNSQFRVNGKKWSSKMLDVAGFTVDAENSASACARAFASQTETSDMANRSNHQNERSLCDNVKTLLTASYHNTGTECNGTSLELNDRRSPFNECLDMLASNLPVVSDSSKEINGRMESNLSTSHLNKFTEEKLQSSDDSGSENRRVRTVQITGDSHEGHDNSNGASVEDEVESAVSCNVPVISCLDKNEMLNCLTLDLPLEVIGACWFMRRDSETCLQAVTSADEKVLIRLTKKDSRVRLAFEATTPGGRAFEPVRNGCRCCIDALLEPPRRPSSVEVNALCSDNRLSDSADCRSTKIVADENSTTVTSVTSAVSLRLRARPSAGIHYEDSDEDGDVRSLCDNSDQPIVNNVHDDNEEDEELEYFDESVDEVDEDEADENEEEKDYTDDEIVNVPDPKGRLPISETVESIPSDGQGRRTRSKRIIVNGHKEDDDDDDDGTDYDWNPPKQSKLSTASRPGIRIKVKIKSEPQTSEDQVLLAEEVRRVDDVQESGSEETDGENSDAADELCTVDRRVPLKTKSHHSKLEPKRSCQKQKISRDTNMVAKVRRLRSKDGPKWEKKGNCPHCGVFYGNLSQHIGLYCPKNPNRQRAYHCCYCKFRSLDRAQLIEHKATHVLARDFKCEICDSAFFTRQRLVRHMRYVHLLGTNPVRIYTCDRCGKRFRYHSHYDRHLTIHSEEKTAQCDKCGKFFKNSHNVRNHQSRMHPGKPETFPYYCDKCGQGTHNLTAHRCIVPGEMHGSRRRRAPRSSLQSASAAANAGETLVDRSMPAELPPAPLVSSSPLTPKPDDRNLETPRVIGDTQVGVVSPETVDCRSSTATCGQSSDYRLGGLPAPPAVEVGITAASSHSVDRHSSARAVASHQQHADRYPSPVTQPFDRHLVPSAANVSFDHDSSQHLDRRLTTGARSSYGNPHHHHHPVTMPDVEPPYDRRVPPPFEHHLPVMAHQPPQQPAYSNLFAVDPLLQVQLRAANMMYRMDY